MEIEYPIRCKIIDVTGQEYHPGLKMRTPDKSKPYIGKEGVAEKIGDYVRITLDDGHIIYGYECWWEPIKPPSPRTAKKESENG